MHRTSKALIVAAGGLAVLVAGPSTAATTGVQGPAGTSSSKVLVIGTDGTNWSTVRRLMSQGRLPALARIARHGFAKPAPLAYKPPAAYTVSQVGWTSIASGVWPDKHGVSDASNESRGQVTKNGYADFLTRIEASRPGLSTMLISDWGNIGTTTDNGPIFPVADAKRAVAAGNYDAQDKAGSLAAARHIRTAGPDASFVYLGLVDEVGHAHGPDSDAYTKAIVRTDRRIGRLLRAVAQRPNRQSEAWTVMVTTDHGQIERDGVGVHGGGSRAERRSFLIAQGPGLPSQQTVGGVRVVDITPTVLRQLGVPVVAPTDLDGTSLAP